MTSSLTRRIKSAETATAVESTMIRRGYLMMVPTSGARRGRMRFVAPLIGKDKPMSPFARRLDKAEAVIAPKVQGRWIVFEVGDDVPRDVIEAFERDVLAPRPNDIVVRMRDFIDCLSAPRHLTTYALASGR